MTSILSRIRANGGDVTRQEWRFAFKRGRLSQEAVAWVKARWSEVCAEAWPPFWDWQERAAIREYDGGQIRADAERDAYGEVAQC
ncbi:MAG: hypothetical protein ACK4FB_08030 [Brevundimonas sp.]|uniref:hypothetical protein n=1 Tax=Brevundimonas sp. TaxID=1871086 RepID=UPI00391B5225